MSGGILAPASLELIFLPALTEVCRNGSILVRGSYTAFASLEPRTAGSPRKACPTGTCGTQPPGALPHGRERTGHTLQTTALVNEAYLRLVDSSQVRWQNRAHFMAVSA